MITFCLLPIDVLLLAKNVEWTKKTWDENMCLSLYHLSKFTKKHIFLSMTLLRKPLIWVFNLCACPTCFRIVPGKQEWPSLTFFVCFDVEKCLQPLFYILINIYAPFHCSWPLLNEFFVQIENCQVKFSLTEVPQLKFIL